MGGLVVVRMLNEKETGDDLKDRVTHLFDGPPHEILLDVTRCYLW